MMQECDKVFGCIKYFPRFRSRLIYSNVLGKLIEYTGQQKNYIQNQAKSRRKTMYKEHTMNFKQFFAFLL